MNRAAPFRWAWWVVPRAPLRMVEAASAAAADAACALGVPSVRMLARNHARILGRAPTRREVRAAVRSYFRCFAHQFALPGMSRDQVGRAVRAEGVEPVLADLRDGPVVLALTHTGNWDLAGAWFCRFHAPVVTVAERLDPPELFQRFLDFRRSLGMTIVPAARGEHVFERLVEQCAGRRAIVPLLADRDITGSGIEVDLAGYRALVAAGPAALAERLGRPLYAATIAYERRGGRWGIAIHFTPPIPPARAEGGATAVENRTRAWVRAVEPTLARHVVDWHMMQRVFVDDLDPARLARARARHAASLRAQGRPGIGGAS